MHFHPTPEGSVGIPALNIVKPNKAWNNPFHAPSINQLKLKI